jgi:hypothetical protein
MIPPRFLDVLGLNAGLARGDPLRTALCVFIPMLLDDTPSCRRGGFLTAVAPLPRNVSCGWCRSNWLL